MSIQDFNPRYGQLFYATETRKAYVSANDFTVLMYLGTSGEEMLFLYVYATQYSVSDGVAGNNRSIFSPFCDSFSGYFYDDTYFEQRKEAHDELIKLISNQQLHANYEHGNIRVDFDVPVDPGVVSAANTMVVRICKEIVYLELLPLKSPEKAVNHMSQLSRAERLKGKDYVFGPEFTSVSSDFPENMKAQALGFITRFMALTTLMHATPLIPPPRASL